MEAMIERAGRVGRCKDGVYIPCFSAQQLQEVPQEYGRPDILQKLPSFILNFLANREAFGSVKIDQIISKYSMKIDEEQVMAILGGLAEKQQVKRAGDDYLITNIGKQFMSEEYERVFTHLGLPEMIAVINANSFQDLDIFVHPFEVELYPDDYKYAVLSQNTIKYIAFTDTPSSFIHLNNINEIQHQFFENELNELLIAMWTSSDIHAYSEPYAIAKVVALWRQYFPVPTIEPTAEELQWCRQRLLNYDTLREFELNIISFYAGVSRENRASEISAMENNMLKQLYPCTLTELQEYFGEIGYEPSHLNSTKLHKEAYEKAARHFNVHQNFVSVRLLEAEQKCGRDVLNSLITAYKVLENENASFYQNVDTVKEVTKKRATRLKQQYTQHLRFANNCGLGQEDARTLFEEKQPLNGEEKCISVAINEQFVQFYFKCSNEQALRLKLALVYKGDIDFNGKKLKGSRKQVMSEIMESFEATAPLLPSSYSGSFESFNKCGSADVYGKQLFDVQSMQPFLPVADNTVLTCMFFNERPSRHCLSENGLATYLLAFCFNVRGAVSLTVEDNIITSFSLLEDQKIYYSCSDFNLLEQCIFVSIQKICNRFGNLMKIDSSQEFANLDLSKYRFNEKVNEFLSDFTEKDILPLVNKFLAKFGNVQSLKECMLEVTICGELTMPTYVCV